MENNFCQVWLSCKDGKEAAGITDALLTKRLVACAKQIPVGSTFHWQGKIEHDDEVLLLMESRLDLFDEIEREVAKLHSYDTFVLEAVPVARVSKDALKWLRRELKDE